MDLFPFFSQAHKKRFFCLKQQKDTTYVFEFYKDEKKGEAKGFIYLDSATQVQKVVA